MRELGVFPVKRDTASEEAINTAVQHLNDGDLLAIFPEGTRNGLAKGVKPKKGVALIALRAKTPIIPMAMEGLLGGPFQTDTMTAWLGTAYNLYTLVTCIIAIPMLAIGLILLFSLRPSMPKQTQQADQASTDEQVQNSDTTKEQEI